MIAYGREQVPEKYREISRPIGAKYSAWKNAFQARIFDNEGFNCHRQTKAFLKWANSYDPDVVWLHNLHGYYINIELLFSWIKSRPHMQVRWTLHDCWAFTGHCAHFSLAGCEKWMTQCDHCLQKDSYPKSILRDNCYENYHRKQCAFTGVNNMKLITPSHWLAGLVRESFLGIYPVEVVHNQIDTTVFRPTDGFIRSQFGLVDQKIVLGVASAWDEKKGYSDYLKLASVLGKGYAVMLVGLSGEQMKKLPENVIGITRTDSAQQLAQIYTAADVFVNLTYEDTYPTVNLEAQACGTPCLTYRTGGSVESVPAGNVVEQGNLAQMAARIREICMEGTT
jgi:glycosyltransferase involved in cell wall biosynthesis